MSRYDAMFERLAAHGEGAFVPFSVLGDPDRARSRRVLEALAAGGADALELGIPFSDPVADGPVIQAADVRALEAGGGTAVGLELVAEVRAAHPALPIGLLVYANLVAARGLDAFYAACAAAGVDSVLVADVPAFEAKPFADAARTHGIEPVLIATPGATAEAAERIAALSSGYTYVVTRRGVTGTDADTGDADTTHDPLVDLLAAAGAPPPLFGFGIGRPSQVRAALARGAAGAISGSAVVQRIADHLDDPAAMERALTDFVASMKQATRAESG